MSSNPTKRLEFHNLGLNASTRSGIPWTLVWLSEEMVKDEALQLEKKVKKRGAARFLSDLSGGHA
jgi:putative endonuclease